MRYYSYTCGSFTSRLGHRETILQLKEVSDRRDAITKTRRNLEYIQTRSVKYLQIRIRHYLFEVHDGTDGSRIPTNPQNTFLSLM